jgi:hypothetical protein
MEDRRFPVQKHRSTVQVQIPKRVLNGDDKPLKGFTVSVDDSNQ